MEQLPSRGPRSLAGGPIHWFGNTCWQSSSEQISGLAFADGYLLGSDYDLFLLDPADGYASDFCSLPVRLGGLTVDPSTGDIYGVALTLGNARLYRVTVFEDLPARHLLDTAYLVCSASEVCTLSQNIGVIGSLLWDKDGNMLLGSGFNGPQGLILFDLDTDDCTVSNVRSTSASIQGMVWKY